jgi:hypothetical protein
MTSPPPKAVTTPPPKAASPPPPPVCPYSPHSKKCPYCIPTNPGCIKYTCSKWDGYAKVALKGKKCFDKPISFLAVAFSDEKDKAVCAHNKKKMSNDYFEFSAKCGTYVTLYLSDPKFSNQKGPLMIPGGNPCKSPCKEAGTPCQTCGPFKIYIDCKCKSGHSHEDKKKSG